MAILNGTASADVLTGTGEADTLTGGIGDDVFVYARTGGGHVDVISDFGTVYFSGPITGSQQSTSVTTTASGTFTGALRKGNAAFDWSATITGLDFGGQTAATTDNIVDAHFHLGAPGVNGGVIYGFIGTPNNETDGDTVVTASAGMVRGQWDAGEGNGTTLTAQINNLLNGQIYINFHTPVYPAGEIRGQALAQDNGGDRIDLRGTGITSFAALDPLIANVNGSAELTTTVGGQAYTLRLQGVLEASLSAGNFIFDTGGGPAPTIPANILSSFTSIHLGRSPTAAETAILQNAAGLSGAALNKAIYDTADADTAVAVLAYQYFTGASPSQGGLAFLTNSASNNSDLNDAYYSQFNLENRYINFAANLGIFGEGAAAFQATFGGLTFAQAVAQAYGQIIGYNYAVQAGFDANAAVADISGRIAYFQGVASVGLPGSNQDMATKAAMVGYIMAEAVKADVGAFAAASNAFMIDLMDGSAQFNVNLVGAYAPMAPTGPPSGPGPVTPIDPYYPYIY